ncbi:aspartate kinase [Robiginitalea aurantiaca]|uniref:Aspartate kinase n=1 Tax=Robiginitalea aurantiaca TaxID=3056915 RepID=A0ABT7WBA4_9FLAO|nr:aspartate kinase [Robiginitalea aurantiaca]MDM9630187.1 aspartate kinase [Robiginitalea aurantiaca]
MKTIAGFVAEYVQRKPFLQFALAQGIINLTALSRQIQPEIEAQLKREVRNGAVVMALTRLSDQLEFRATYRVLKVMKAIGEITVRSSLTDYTFRVSDTILQNQMRLLEAIDSHQDVFYTSSRGVDELNIVLSKRLGGVVEEYFREERLTQKVENLSSITVKLPPENVSVPGIYYFIFQRLAWEGIVLYEVISTTNEFTILIDEDQVEQAFSVIKNLKSL